ncbi:SigE family RNA polymerase sigma factor [Actinoallomurus vinaceus]|uniref:SigE family RNA polymerase sigma factor n=1 Tax=Actinoallomurus vinaceus TaxID=1080074 RepID=A0ABP8U1I4_9ACTN
MREPKGAAEAARSAGDRAAFDAFFSDHYRELARFAYLLTGEHDAADDITAEALAEAWRHWSRVTATDLPLAYVRRIVANLAADRTATLVRERRSWRLWGIGREDRTEPPDAAGVVDLREALLRLPAGKRACVVLRYYYGLSERETASTLGIAVGTVKSQSSRGLEELAALLRGSRSAATVTRGRTRRSAKGATQ